MHTQQKTIDKREQYWQRLHRELEEQFEAQEQLLCQTEVSKIRAEDVERYVRIMQGLELMDSNRRTQNWDLPQPDENGDYPDIDPTPTQVNMIHENSRARALRGTFKMNNQPWTASDHAGLRRERAPVIRSSRTSPEQRGATGGGTSQTTE